MPLHSSLNEIRQLATAAFGADIASLLSAS
jgi:hypothetical protein